MRKMHLFSGCVLIVATLITPGRAAPPPTPADLTTCQTKYYTLQTDLPPEAAEVVARHITFMAEEYHARTRGLGKSLDRRLPIYVVSNRATYERLGGMPNSAGVFMGDKLLAHVTDAAEAETWRVIQHEGFHQFADVAIGRDLPVWANEGLAGYFERGVFTGDAFYAGFIPKLDGLRMKLSVREHKLMPLREIMQMSLAAWNVQLSDDAKSASSNYLQTWAMVHFLAHGDDGKYQQAFMKFLAAVGRHQQWERAWTDNFGNNLDDFQKRFDAYWQSVPEGATAQLEQEALVSTITSFYARAFGQRQFFDTFEEFTAAAGSNKLRIDQKDWLPSELLTQALSRAADNGKWSLRRSNPPAVLCRTKDGAQFEGRFQVVDGRVKTVEVIVKSSVKKP